MVCLLVLVVLLQGYLFFSIPSNINNLEKYSGEIEDYGIKENYNQRLNTKGKNFYIRMNNNHEFYSDLKKHKVLLTNYFKKENFIGDSANVWIEKDEIYIEKLTVNNKVVLEYNPPYWNAWIFLIMGILVTTGAILYLKNNADDIKAERGLLGRILFGKKKRK